MRPSKVRMATRTEGRATTSGPETETSSPQARIFCELKRNAIDSKYSAVAAQAAYEQRQRNCHPKKKLADPVVFGKVREKFLEHQWSPEQISQRLKLEKANFSISYSTI